MYLFNKYAIVVSYSNLIYCKKIIFLFLLIFSEYRVIDG